MTEDDARKKWCPYARVMVANKGGVIPAGFPVANRWTEDGSGKTLVPVGVSCLASACMAWRWNHNGPRTGGRIEGGVMTNPGHPSTGYCGLAGRPE